MRPDLIKFVSADGLVKYEPASIYGNKLDALILSRTALKLGSLRPYDLLESPTVRRNYHMAEVYVDQETGKCVYEFRECL